LREEDALSLFSDVFKHPFFQSSPLPGRIAGSGLHGGGRFWAKGRTGIAFMKLGLVRRGFSPTGGAEAYLKRFAEGLRAAGHEPVLFTSSDWPEEAWPDGRFVYLEGKSPGAFAEAFEQARAGRTKTPLSTCDYYFSLERLRGCDCYRAGDGVHRAWLERRCAAEPFWKAPLRLANPFNRKHRELLALEQQLFGKRGARMVIANSHLVKQEIIEHYGYPAERIHVVYNGVPQRMIDPASREQMRAETRKKLGLSPFDYVLLFAGSGWQRKGLEFAIEGMRRANLSRPLLLVAGRGNERQFAPSRRVRFLGPVKGMEPYFAAADAFLLPTLYDPFSNACLEAIAAGLAVITTTANGFSEILQPGVDGEVLDDPTDVESIARAIEGWSSPERRAAIRPHLAELASRFTIEANVQATLEALSGSFSLG
jgi:UDP-glucose:(heptosyl)LPS alpha-1,3-glucosyltransferase